MEGTQNYRSSLQMQNSVLKYGLPVDENKNNELKQVKGYNFSKVTPTPLIDVEIASLSEPCMKWVGLKMPKTQLEEEELSELLSGNVLFKDSVPISHCYGGHQFGYFSGQLGDGRAISLGDVISKQDNQLIDLQLKGAGLTPYSRRADGRAVLRSSIREFLCSEAMYALGVPTSRATSLITSESRVARDKLYNGNVIHEKCAVVMRVAPSFLRFGSFEIFKPKDNQTGMIGPSVGMKDQMMPKMLDYMLEYLFKEINESFSEDTKDQKYKVMFEKIVKDTAYLVALWQCYGFCHGVLNTDNMSILGLTIDYGPYAWMENFDPDYICNHSDQDKGRYRYKAQPEICKWNLYKLCESLDPIVDLEHTTDFVRANFDQFYKDAYETRMAQKLGFLITKPSQNPHDFTGTSKNLIDEDQQFREVTSKEKWIIQSLMEAMQKTGSDFTDTFRTLGQIQMEKDNKPILQKLLESCAPLKLLEKKPESKYSPAELVKLEQILERQPEVLPMLGISVIDAKKAVEDWKASQIKSKEEKVPDLEKQKAQNDKNLQVWSSWLESYLGVLKEAPEYLDCDYDKARSESMDRMNPSFILRNYLMEDAIKSAEDGDFTKVNDLLKKSLNPFQDYSDEQRSHPDWRFDICISCSS